ncbi:MAG: hypothetical protein M3N00_04150 [Actinomycetota bacterium]|nr:hypothetical protein [Actinomycetota bacterium]
MQGGLSGLGRRLSTIGSGFADTFLRDNKVIPPLLALLALLVFAWIVAGIFVGGPGDDEQASNRGGFAQSEDPGEGQDPPAPEVENRNVESYAAYESKDPFRQLLAPPESTTATPPATTPEDTTGGGAGRNGGPSGTTDSDGDGVLDRDDVSGGGQRGGTTGRGGGGGNRGGAGQSGGDLFDSGGNLRLP